MDEPRNLELKDTCVITLTSQEGYGYGDAVCSVSERLRVWGNGHDITNVHPDASMFNVYPVEPMTHEECPIGQGAVLTAARPAQPTILFFAQVVSITPAKPLREVLF